MPVKNPFTKVIKRDGRVVDFDQDRITKAVLKAMQAVGEGDLKHNPQRISDWVVQILTKRYPPSHIPKIEEIQDAVEEVLIIHDFPKTAKAYILYRQERARIREKRKLIPDRIKKIAEASKKCFRNDLSEFIYYRTYSRWIEEEGRRETWLETIDRFMNYMHENLKSNLKEKEYEEVKQAILFQKVMPSMRLMWSAGKACRATNVTAYNCSFIAPTRIDDLAEIMYLLMCGTGVGFSVESQTAQQFPIIKRQTGKVLKTHVIADSKEGWGDALTLGLRTWFRGLDIKFDYSQVRPAGSRLKTMGGRSSGPEPLRSLLDFTRAKVLARQGKRLHNIDLHDIICKIGEAVVAGGVRRCLPKTTLVHTKKGLKPIKNIGLGEELLTTKGRYRKVVALKYTGKRQLVNINTQLGTFQSTPEHRWAVLDDLAGHVRWVEAAKLTPDDVLVYIPDIIPGVKTNLPPYRYKKAEHSTTTQDIVIPELDKEMAWLIGYFHGNGYVYRKNYTYGEVMFACSPDMPETAEKVKRNLERFGVTARIIRAKGDNAIRIRTKSNQLANYLYQFKQPKESITIPSFILEGTPEIRVAYIAGVFDADGSVKSRNGKKVRPIVASSIYPDWLRQLRAVLASVDIPASIRLHRPARGKWRPLYHLSLISREAYSKFEQHAGGLSEKWDRDAKAMERKVEDWSVEDWSFVVPKNLLARSPYRRLFEHAYYLPSSRVRLSLSKFERTLTQVEDVPQDVVNTLSLGYGMSLQPYRPVRIINTPTRSNREETYDIQVEEDECFVAEGMLVHNSAMISLSDLDDEEMRNAKTGQFFLNDPQRSMANNSAVYNEKPTATQFLEEWLALAEAGTGERGIFNRGGLKNQLPRRRWQTFKKHSLTAGTNPCGEIILRSKQFCNLTEVVARPEDTEKTLLRKIELAALLGTYQSTLTKFPYLSKEWKRNCEEERLLGISITGQWDCPVVRRPEILAKLRKKAIEVNRKYAKRFGINPSTCVTCVKPSGTVSQLVDASSGMHPRHAPYYIRRVRISATDPLFQMLKDQKFPYKPEVGQAEGEATTYVLEFPVAAPQKAIFRDDLSAIKQLEHWKTVKENYTEHNPSVTVSVGKDEWIRVADWLYERWDILGGLSFLPRSEHVYPLAPYEEITKEEYTALKARLPKIDFSQILVYEHDDQTTGAKELACVSGVCDADDLVEVDFSSVKGTDNNNNTA